MIAEQTDTETINLDEMTTPELLHERGLVKVAIAEIAAQLKDATRRPAAPEDDSPEWEAYRDWRRRARWAEVHQRRDLETIKQILRERHDTHRAASLLRHGLASAITQSLEDQALIQARRERLRQALREQTPTLLVLRLSRVIRRLIGANHEMPETMDQADRDALTQMAMLLKSEYGREAVKAFCDSDGSLEPAS